MSLPLIIQGGMGAGVSDYRLAKAVSLTGELGVVSGTALDAIFIRRLQAGDISGDVRRALESFPIPAIAERIIEEFFIKGGKAAKEAFKRVPMFKIEPPQFLSEIMMCANFVEVFLAKEGHDNPVGINYLEKIQMPNISAIYGAMMAGVDYVLMGAGIPREIPGLLDKFSNHEEMALSINVEGATGDDNFKMTFNPKDVNPNALVPLKRPKFLAIIASTILATTLSRKANGKVDGFIIEGPKAGGHNAAPRGAMNLTDDGQPIYGDKDVVNLEKIKSIGLPFWLAGTYGSPEKVKEAKELGAEGVQVGTAFAFCKESGFTTEYKDAIIKKVLDGSVEVFTDPIASPTGFPFKAVLLENSCSEKETYEKRPRVCDLGYLRHPYRKDDGSVGYRCPSEPIASYIKKGGKEEDTVGKKCLCNGLLSNIGLPQYHTYNEYEEAPYITAGDDLIHIGRFIKDGETEYSASDVINVLKG